MRSDVVKIFDECLDKRFGTKPEVLKFLKRHERKDSCINNLCAEISKMEGLRLLYNAKKYRLVIDTVSNMFAARALQVAEERALSDSEKTRRRRENDSLEYAKETIKELTKDGALREIGADDDSETQNEAEA